MVRGMFNEVRPHFRDMTSMEVKEDLGNTMRIPYTTHRHHGWSLDKRVILFLTWAEGAKAATPEMRAKDNASFMVG
jgi:hypothetical protein